MGRKQRDLRVAQAHRKVYRNGVEQVHVIDGEASVICQNLYRLPALVIVVVMMTSDAIGVRVPVAAWQVENDDDFILVKCAVFSYTKARYMLPFQVP